MPGDLGAAWLVHEHVCILSLALVTAQPPNPPTHREGIAEPCRKLARAPHRGMPHPRGTAPDVQAGLDFIGERGGRSFR